MKIIKKKDRQPRREILHSSKQIHNLVKHSTDIDQTILQYIGRLVCIARSVFGPETIDEIIDALWEESEAAGKGLCTDCCVRPAMSIECPFCKECSEEVQRSLNEQLMDLTNWEPDSKITH